MANFLKNGHFSDRVVETPEVSINEKDPVAVFVKQLLLCKESEAGTSLYNSMTLSTIGPEGRVHSRIMLLKAVEEGRLYFFTNYGSRKSEDISFHPQVSLLFYWPVLNRQVIIDGLCTQASREISKTYFATRPRLSQIGAHASHQSQPLKSRDEFMNRFTTLESQFGDGEIPCPDSWGGYEVVPNRMEFWKGLEGRLHERLSFVREGNSWSGTLLNP